MVCPAQAADVSPHCGRVPVSKLAVQGRYNMGVFSRVLTGSLQGITERPLPCNYNVIQFVCGPFTAQTRVQIQPGTPTQ